MNQLRTETVPVITEYFAESGLSVASFEWPEGNALETYTIAVGDFASIALDKHSPVRPESVEVHDDGLEQSAEMLTTLVGEEITEALLDAKKVGFATLSTFLSPENRLAIAGIQGSSPSTPHLVRELSKAMMSGNSRPNEGVALETALAFPRRRGSRRAANQSQRDKNPKTWF